MRAQFNPDTLEIQWATPYQQAHEWAHLEQMILRTWTWRLRERWMGRLFERVANLAVELEASRMAKRDLGAAWTQDDADEARLALVSYVLSIVNPKLLQKLFLPSRI